ncbi:DENND4B [Cordylochernes scorpioides]|uniref:DENND4B n=1 Tax=Cordylochernes scorpioides TaxID=51811 RepID=A0ABY6KV78_9ARAC|nr:DENND4B [Cordylochernes scorpioides]
MLLGERSKVWPPRQQGPAARHHRSLYRELLFLSMVVLGRSSIDQLAFDIEFQRACAGLESPAHQAALLPADRPPTPAATFCRRFFRELELLV